MSSKKKINTKPIITIFDILDYAEGENIDPDLFSQMMAILLFHESSFDDNDSHVELEETEETTDSSNVMLGKAPVTAQGFYNFRRIPVPPPPMKGGEATSSNHATEVEKIHNNEQYGFRKDRNYFSCQLDWDENQRKLNAPYYFLLIQALDPRSGRSLGQALLPVRPDKVAKNRVVGTLATTELAEILGITREQLLDDKQCAIYLMPLGPENIEELDSSLIKTLRARLKKNPQSPYLDGVRLLLADWDDDLTEEDE
jgi:hypothetical protein